MATRVTAFAGTHARESHGWWLALPAVFWLVTFFILPLIIVLILSFMTTRGATGAAVIPLTFSQYQRVFDVYDGILIRSIWIAFLTTVICLLAGYPLAFFIKTRQSLFGRQFALFLVILPFWTNFLVRTYAWRMLLSNEGVVNGLLQRLSLIDEPLQILNTEFAVLLGLVYGFLPFMVLPIYASVERFDFRYVEAARDLGANDWHTFWRVVLPLTLPGVIAGCILVFVPAIGSFVTPDLLGGIRVLMIGNLIQGQYLRNIPLGSALSMVMMTTVMIALLIYMRFADKEGRR